MWHLQTAQALNRKLHVLPFLKATETATATVDAGRDVDALMASGRGCRCASVIDVDDCVGASTIAECGNGLGAIYECGCGDIPERDCDCDGNQLDQRQCGDGVADADAGGNCDNADCVGCARRLRHLQRTGAIYESSPH